MKQLSAVKTLNRVACVLFLSIFVSILVPSILAAELSTTVKKYPPYPDVWGYELPWSDKNSRQSAIMIFKQEDGDYVAMYIKKMKKKRRNDGSCCTMHSEQAGLSFFSGKKWTGKEVGDFADKHRQDRVPREFGKPHPWVFEDGSELQQGGGSAGRCPNTLQEYLMMLDQKKNTVAEKRLIYLLEKPIRRPVCYPSERNENLEAKTLTMRVQAVEPYIIPLEDHTFLLYDKDGNIIMRFDRDFNTKSEILNRRVFAVDRQAMDAFVLEYMKQRNLEYNDQTLNDAVYDYVTTLKKAGTQ